MKIELMTALLVYLKHLKQISKALLSFHDPSSFFNLDIVWTIKKVQISFKELLKIRFFFFVLNRF